MLPSAEIGSILPVERELAKRTHSPFAFTGLECPVPETKRFGAYNTGLRRMVVPACLFACW